MINFRELHKEFKRPPSIRVVIPRPDLISNLLRKPFVLLSRKVSNHDIMVNDLYIPWKVDSQFETVQARVHVKGVTIKATSEDLLRVRIASGFFYSCLEFDTAKRKSVVDPKGPAIRNRLPTSYFGIHYNMISIDKFCDLFLD